MKYKSNKYFTWIIILLVSGFVKIEAQSCLEVLDVTTGDRTLIREYSGKIESPEWTPDGRYIIYNSEGKLFRIAPVPGSDPVEINTGYAKSCNNDHVVSFDGSVIGISHRTKEDGLSRIYTIPSGGGIPRLITPLAPSYLHGWSPDGKYLSYCALRNNNYDIYIIPSEGGEEIRLTTTEDMDDGAEYSPDGRFIWFNSVRTGLMQLWRMKADGSEQTQMTFDETRNSWFPHVSPDGMKILYITYRKGDLQPNQHLGGKNVEIRLMPAAGGESRTLVSFYGGQGSLNVNSWAPDSRRAAFVSYKQPVQNQVVK